MAPQQRAGRPEQPAVAPPTRRPAARFSPPRRTSDNARRGYRSRVAGFLDWLSAGPDLGADGDPLTHPAARDYAVRDYRS